MITIDQLLESVDLDFEPRWVTQDEYGVTIFADKPKDCENAEQWFATNPTSGFAEYDGLKLAEFENKHWKECIYEVPRKTTGNLKHIERIDDSFVDKINAIIDVVNELKGAKNE